EEIENCVPQPNYLFSDGKLLPIGLRRKCPSSLICKQLEEIDPYYAKSSIPTFVVIDQNYEIHRYSATKSLFIFSPTNMLRKFAINVESSLWFRYLVHITIIMFLIGVTYPTSSSAFFHGLKIFILMFWLIELLVHLIARGLIMSPFSFLRDLLNLFDLIATVDLFLFVIFANTFSIAPIRGFRLLRGPLRNGIRLLEPTISRVLKKLRSTIVLFVCVIFITSLFALQAFMGNLRNICAKRAPLSFSNIQWFLWYSNRMNWISEQRCSNYSFGLSCHGEESICMVDFGENPDNGYTNFDTLGWSMISTIRIMTLDYWESVYNDLLAVSGLRSLFFFIPVIYFVAFFFVAIIAAVVCKSFSLVYEEDLKNKTNSSETSQNAREKLTRIITNPYVELSFKFCIVLNVIALTIIHNLSSQVIDIILEIVTDCFNIIFICEVCVKMFCLTPANYFKENGNKLDFIILCVTFGFFIADGYMLNPFKLGSFRKEAEVVLVSDAERNETEEENEDNTNIMQTQFTINMDNDKTSKMSVFVRSTHFNYAILFVIIVSCILLILEDANLSSKPTLQQILYIADKAILLLFVFEMVFKWMGFGLKTYFSSPLNCLDFIIVLLWLINTFIKFTAHASISLFSVCRVLRIFRLLEIIYEEKETKLILNTFRRSIMGAVNVIFVILFSWYVFAMIGVYLFSSAFEHCEDFSGAVVNFTLARNKEICMQNNFTWVNPQINFDNIFNAYLALLEIATSEGHKQKIESSETVLASDVYSNAMRKIRQMKPARAIPPPQIYILQNLYNFVRSELYEAIIVSFIIVNIDLMVVHHFLNPALFRVFRVFKFAQTWISNKYFMGINTLTFIWAKSFPLLIRTYFLLSLVIVVYAVFGMHMFMHVELQNGLNEICNFRTFINAILLLFPMSTTAGWDQVLAALMDQTKCETTFDKDDPGNCGNKAAAIIYVLSYIVLCSFVIINIGIAVIFDSYNQVKEEVKKGLTDKTIRMFLTKWQYFDPNASQFINSVRLIDFLDSLEEPLHVSSEEAASLNIPLSDDDMYSYINVFDSLVKRLQTKNRE
ncbi:Sodium channel protein para-like protein, partial [Dinothrombium tinctorium]